MQTSAAFLCCSFAICLQCFGQDKPNTRWSDQVKSVPEFAKRFAQLKPVPSTACAHMVIIPTPQDVDSRMIKRVPEKNASRMPIHKGLPACGSLPAVAAR